MEMSGHQDIEEVKSLLLRYRWSHSRGNGSKSTTLTFTEIFMTPIGLNLHKVMVHRFILQRVRIGIRCIYLNHLIFCQASSFGNLALT